MRGRGREGWKLQTNRFVQQFTKAEDSLGEEIIIWWGGPLLTLPGELNVSCVRDKDNY